MLSLVLSCGKNEKNPIQKTTKTEKKQQTVLPFTTIELKDLSAFKPTGANWKVVGDVFADRTKNKTLYTEQGTGILINTNDQEKNKNLFTSFSHGDIELEIDVMMPLKSNSGLYFQGRYEVQLFDSWGVEQPKYVDMGGIYQRWNKDAEKGKEGYEGHAPITNAAKAPGLWQHLKIIFHAPKFGADGKKTKNAWFEEVSLNGVLLHKNVELTGPTRGGNAKEVALAPLMIQGDHGAVAIKNIAYKLYENKKLGIENTTLEVYENPNRQRNFKQYDTLPKLDEIKTDSISPLARFKDNLQQMLKYSGTFNVPSSGDYLFDINVYGKGLLVVNNDTLINTSTKDYEYGKITLEKGKASYTLMYNKPFPWGRSFDVHVEGPKIQRYSILETSMNDINKNKTIKPILVTAKNKTKIQRSFVQFKDYKKTHAINVGLVEKLNYAFDLSTGSLLYVWGGDFLNTTSMWHSRGNQQIGFPNGFIVSSHGELDFYALKNLNQTWPKTLSDDIKFNQIGYKRNNKGTPEFFFNISDAEISTTFVSSTKTKRGLNRIIQVNSKQGIYHKIAEGQNIKALPNASYIINNESYYIDFSGNNTLKPIIRSINSKEELLVNIPAGKQTLQYSIIW
ncbi:hypothetical protein GCM10022291_14160 [Postechiella marina]|uniref:PA14 domain-containing protein n=1 Tax=Postechiella marina TaxID=943941 RepID=A0ABP8C6N2_9FLAO